MTFKATFNATFYAVLMRLIRRLNRLCADARLRVRARRRPVNGHAPLSLHGIHVTVRIGSTVRERPAPQWRVFKITNLSARVYWVRWARRVSVNPRVDDRVGVPGF